MVPNLDQCSLGLRDETLSAWRDELLSAAEMQRIEQHNATCPACQMRLSAFREVARVLRSQRELEPGERIIAGVRSGAARRGRARRGPRLLVRRNLSILLPVAAVLLLSIYVFHMGYGLGKQQPPIATAQSTATTKPATPSTTPSKFSPMVDAVTAWGQGAETVSLTTQLDASHVFVGGALSPDGHTLLGYRAPLPPSGTPATGNLPTGTAEEGLYEIATHQFTPIGIANQAAFPPMAIALDGRYAIVEDYDQPQATGAVLHLRVWAYDLVTHQMQVTRGSTYQGLLGVAYGHGLVVMTTTVGIEVQDLAAQRTTQLAQTATNAKVVGFTWPYVLYGQVNTDSTQSAFHVRDLVSRQDVVLPQLPPSVRTAAFVGDTLFYIELAPYGDNATLTPDQPTSTLYQLDHALTAGAQPKALGTSSADLYLRGANDRLVIFPDRAWDRAERRFVTLGEGVQRSAPGGVTYREYDEPVALAGQYIAVLQLATLLGDTAVQRVTVYDTAHLPALSGP